MVASTCVIVTNSPPSQLTPVTNSPQTFHWVGIPQPVGVDQCQLGIKASVAGQYQFPDKYAGHVGITQQLGQDC